MIPKKVHCCWFGPGKKSDTALRCEESLRRFLPEYELCLWTDSNCPRLPFVEQCMRWGKWALLSDYIRLYALLNHGGIYLDTDVEILRPLDELLGYSCFLGFEEDHLTHKCASNAVLAAVPAHPFIQECYDAFAWSLHSRVKPFYGVKIGNIVLFKNGLVRYGTQTLGDVTLLSKECLHPDHNHVTAAAYCIHWLEGSWHRKRGWKHAQASGQYKTARLLALAKLLILRPQELIAHKTALPRKRNHRAFMKQLRPHKTMRAEVLSAEPACHRECTEMRIRT